MNIQWYPGHMAKAKREIKEKLKIIDIVIELLDSRIPMSSKNPQIDEIIGQKKKIIVLNKMDLADPSVNNLWEKYYTSKSQNYIFINSISGTGIGLLIKKMEEMMEPTMRRNIERGRINKPIRCMIIGVPNVGKSTLINSLAKKSSAKTGNKPGITKAQQWIKVSNKIQLLDTPGILWPKFEDIDTGLRLAWIGSIKDTLYDKEEVAVELLKFLIKNYPDQLLERYKISNINLDNTLLLFEQIANKRGFVLKGGGIDYTRTAEMLLDEMKNAKIGKFSLERP